MTSEGSLEGIVKRESNLETRVRVTPQVSQASSQVKSNFDEP